MRETVNIFNGFQNHFKTIIFSKGVYILNNSLFISKKRSGKTFNFQIRSSSLLIFLVFFHFIKMFVMTANKMECDETFEPAVEITMYVVQNLHSVCNSMQYKIFIMYVTVCSTKSSFCMLQYVVQNLHYVCYSM